MPQPSDLARRCPQKNTKLNKPQQFNFLFAHHFFFTPLFKSVENLKLHQRNFLYENFHDLPLET